MDCDKCGGDVPLGNDATALEVLIVYPNSPMNALVLSMAHPRHLLPVPGCPGTPSRAQYFEGFPHDADQEYQMYFEHQVRDAYIRLQQLADGLGS